jgi:hypothetical protein
MHRANEFRPLLAPRLLSLVVLAIASAPACGAPNSPDPDAGPTIEDAGFDAPRAVDGGPEGDGGPRDAGAPDAGGEDGGALDGGPRPDAGVDAGGDAPCEPVICPEPPPGCSYVGASVCSCGRLRCTLDIPCSPVCEGATYCDRCAASPECVARPMDMGLICPAIYMPVCGCDGRTYPNACALGSAGIALDYEGECASGPACDGTTCDGGSYCDWAAACSGTGTCTPAEPEGTCDGVVDPVCACDGFTYANICDAHAAGQDVAYAGACMPRPGECAPGVVCVGDEFCDHNAGCDGPGRCVPYDPFGSCPIGPTPVCGCDGTTYGNVCEATRAGVDVATDRACGVPPDACLMDRDCLRRERCLLCADGARRCIPESATGC